MKFVPARFEGFTLALMLAVMAGILAPVAAVAQATPPADAKVPPIKLTPEEIAEKEGRKACKAMICAAFRLKQPGPDIACHVIKSWRKENLDKTLSKARVSWPWGRIRCTADIKLKRELLLKAMMEKSFELQLDEHKVNCQVETKSGPADIKFSFKPKVRFENGKAVKASLNWGKIEAPTLVKGVMWTATATDNTFNVLQGSVVDDINSFIGARCNEIKDVWEKK